MKESRCHHINVSSWTGMRYTIWEIINMCWISSIWTRKPQKWGQFVKSLNSFLFQGYADFFFNYYIYCSQPPNFTCGSCHVIHLHLQFMGTSSKNHIIIFWRFFSKTNMQKVQIPISVKIIAWCLFFCISFALIRAATITLMSLYCALCSTVFVCLYLHTKPI